MEYSENLPRQLVEGVKIFYGTDSVVLLPNPEYASFGIYADASDPESAKNLITQHENLINSWKLELE